MSRLQRAADSTTLTSLIRHRSLFRLLLASFLLIACASQSWAQSRVVGVLAYKDDAYVAYDAAQKLWSVGSRGMQVQVGFSKSGTLSLLKIWNPDANRDWGISADAEVGVTINGEALTLQDAGTRTRFLQAAALETDTGVSLNLVFEHRELHTVITRVYAAYPGSPTIETWTRIDQPGGLKPVEVSDMAGWQLTMPVARVRWVNGLRGATSNAMVEATFAIDSRNLDDGASVEIGAQRRSSETYEPFIFVDGPQGFFYGGVIWSGAWRMFAERQGDRISVLADVPWSSPIASADRPVEFPHTFFGVSEPTPDAQTLALRQFVMRGMRKGRPFQPLVTYNTWFPYGSRVNEGMILDEMQRASVMGVELFVLDAGWYVGAGTLDYYDFSTGLGSWAVDLEKFPSNLENLASRAHDLGMRFGIWVEPERVALATVGNPGLAREEWLAMQDGTYGDATTAQLCLANESARQWLFAKIVELIDRVHPDYLKWDNNFWLNCNRTDHDHNANDGNYAHVVALYGMLDELRQRYPDMLLENVSGGGNRLDFGMLAYSDVAWMDDHTAPSWHVRHNLEGLSIAFPPAYLLSFVINSEEEPIAGGVDFAHIARSRMPGVLGLTYKGGDIDPQLGEVMGAEIAQYKIVRDTISQAHAVLLGEQAPVDNGWDVIQLIAEDRKSLIIFAFKAVSDEGRLLVKPRNLIPTEKYQLGSMDSGGLGVETGANLMQNGIEIVHVDGSRAHVIYLGPPTEAQAR